MAQIIRLPRKPRPPLGGWGFDRIAALAAVLLVLTYLIYTMNPGRFLGISPAYQLFMIATGLAAAAIIKKLRGK